MNDYECHLCNCWLANESAYVAHEAYHAEKLRLGPHNVPPASPEEMDEMADDLVDLLDSLSARNSIG